VPVLIECLNPPIARLNGKLTSIALSLKHYCPVYNTNIHTVILLLLLLFAFVKLAYFLQLFQVTVGIARAVYFTCSTSNPILAKALKEKLLSPTAPILTDVDLIGKNNRCRHYFSTQSSCVIYILFRNNHINLHYSAS